MRNRHLANDGPQLTSHDLGDGVESLGYWQTRARQLPWYRVWARREATQMALRWEQRVGFALVTQRGVPMALRMSAGVLVARTRLWRLSRRVAAGATLVVALLALPALAAFVWLAQALL